MFSRCTEIRFSFNGQLANENLRSFALNGACIARKPSNQNFGTFDACTLATRLFSLISELNVSLPPSVTDWPLAETGEKIKRHFLQQLRVHHFIQSTCYTVLVSIMDSDDELDKRIEFAEKRVLMSQARVMEQKDEASQIMRRLEREAQGLEEIKKEWLKKKNLEAERSTLERAELNAVHRHAIEDLRLTYEKDREEKCWELKALIKDTEKEIQELQQKREEVNSVTRAEESKIKVEYQIKLSNLLRDETSVARKGVVKQKRLLGAPNVFSVSLERGRPGMKRSNFRRKI